MLNTGPLQEQQGGLPGFREWDLLVLELELGDGGGLQHQQDAVGHCLFQGAAFTVEGLDQSCFTIRVAVPSESRYHAS